MSVQVFAKTLRAIGEALISGAEELAALPEEEPSVKSNKKRKPRRASAYQLYVVEQTKRLKIDSSKRLNDDGESLPLFTVIGKMWREESEETKKHYDSLASALPDPLGEEGEPVPTKGKSSKKKKKH